MGGPGSGGNWYRWHKKDTADGCCKLDVRYLHRRKLMIPGHYTTLRWSRGEQEAGSIGLMAYTDRVELRYRHRHGNSEWQDVTEAVKLTWTECHYGGRRPWFICPGVVNGVSCGRRVAILYDGGRYFLCRHCYDLTYESRREDRMNRALSKAQNIRRRLGGSASMLAPFPEKPKGMHWKTYVRLLRRALEGERAYDAAFWDWFRRSDARIERLLARGNSRRHNTRG
ncbi:MAG: hypothetical protein EPO21_19230 [Chloroflexota bacterium]|nr:MAG: hypothetical protein EPO21_19230 [Chloroflexota bacterium]